jgi:hypothetical protein
VGSEDEMIHDSVFLKNHKNLEVSIEKDRKGSEYFRVVYVV